MSRDFSKGKIYKITNDYNDDVYVGSTCDTLGRRFSRHKADMKREKCKNRKLFMLMNEIGFERFRIQLIIDYPCEDQYQLGQKEGEYIRLIGTLNKRIEGRTKKEYYENNKDKVKEYYENNKDKVQEYRENNKYIIKEVKKEYYETNKDDIKEKQKIYYHNNKDKIKEYIENNKEKIKEAKKEYYENNKGNAKEYYENNKDNAKEYYVNNKDKLLKNIKCVCGCDVVKCNLNRHMRSQKHLNVVEQLKSNSNNISNS
jgi:hypothetical protein